MKETVLAYIHINHKYLMLYRNKKKNDINEGKWIGIGGHLEDNETSDQCLIREIKEETGLDVLNFVYRGKLLFINGDFKEVMHLYYVDSVKGELIDCDEGHLEWIDEDKLLTLNMWEGDKAFLPLLMDNEKFICLELKYNKNELISVIEWDGIY